MSLDSFPAWSNLWFYYSSISWATSEDIEQDLGQTLWKPMAMFFHSGVDQWRQLPGSALQHFPCVSQCIVSASGLSNNATGEMIQNLCKEKRCELCCLSLTHKVYSQATRRNLTGLRECGLDNPIFPVTFYVLTESWSQQSFQNEIKFILPVNRFQDSSVPHTLFFFKDKHDFFPFLIWQHLLILLKFPKTSYSGDLKVSLKSPWDPGKLKVPASSEYFQLYRCHPLTTFPLHWESDQSSNIMMARACKKGFSIAPDQFCAMFWPFWFSPSMLNTKRLIFQKLT